jgi:hypothetical protein
MIVFYDISDRTSFWVLDHNPFFPMGCSLRFFLSLKSHHESDHMFLVNRSYSANNWAQTGRHPALRVILLPGRTVPTAEMEIL